MSSKFKEGRLVGKGVADWWVLGTRPLGMAPHESLDDTEMMRIKRMGGKRERRPVARWPCPGDTACLSLCCARIYIVKFYLPTYSLDYESIKQRKRVRAISPCGMVARGPSCGVDVSGNGRVCRVAM